MSNDQSFILPAKLDSYLATLNRLYEQKNETVLRDIIVNGKVSIYEGWEYDNWDGGIHGHAVTLTVPEALYFSIMESKNDLQSRIDTDINKINNIHNEHISEVFIEMEPKDSDLWREQSGVYRPPIVSSVSSEALQRIWGAEHVRIFLSHKASCKRETKKLKVSCTRCGISAFVAHKDIKPTLEWQSEIEKALFSMDVLVALLTDDFHESNWTDQEVGVALGRGVPVIAVRLGKDPYGLIGKNQGLSECSWSDTDSMAVKIFKLLYKLLPDKSRLFECALSVYSASDSFNDSAWKVEHLLSVFESLTTNQIDKVVDAYQSNDQNKQSFKGRARLLSLLKKWTGKSWTVKNNTLVLTEPRRRRRVSK